VHDSISILRSGEEAEMELGLTGKCCVVTGASRGIGRAIALGLAAEGAHVAVCARGVEQLRQTAAELRARGVEVHAEACDVGEPAQLAAFLDASRRALGGVDVLVHNASALAQGPDPASWEASLRVDLMAAVHACDQVAPWMEAAGGGSILFISSVSGLDASPVPDFGYTAAKAALLAHAKKLSVLLAPRRIRVNAVAPGPIEFPGGLWAGVREHNRSLHEAVSQATPWGRLGTPEEVADLVLFLVSPRASWVTGEAVVADGGLHRGMR
jgi:3-oxoacyl-[acyl-carrier protein] reductase